MQALVHGIEVNDRHGAGILLRRIFPESGDFLVIRSRSLYAGAPEFGSREIFLAKDYLTRREWRHRFRTEGSAVGRILCVPYFPEDFRAAVLLAEETGAPMCTYLMDDQNIYEQAVGDRSVRRLLEASRIRFAISPQMAAAYEAKFGLPFFWLPPVVDPPGEGAVNPIGAVNPDRLALIGNFWSAGQLAEFRSLVRRSGFKVDWFGRGPEASWLGDGLDSLTADGIVVQGFVPEKLLLERVRACGVAVVPGGSMDANDDKLSFTALSLPSRIVYLAARAKVPVLLLGNPASASGVFLRETGTGCIAAYDPDSLAATIRSMREGDFSEALDEVSRKMALGRAGDWLWESMRLGRPADQRFEEMATPAFRALPVPFDPENAGPLLPVPQNPILRRVAPDPLRWLYSRKSQLRWINQRAPLSATGHHSFLPAAYQRSLAAAILRRSLRGHSSVLLLGGAVADLRPVADRFEIVTSPNEADRYDAVVSFDNAGAPGVGTLGRLGRPGALQLHFWTAYLSPWSLTAPDAAMRLLKARVDPEVLVDRIADDADFLFMSSKSIAQFWPKRVVAEVEQVGRPFSLNLCWQS